MNLHIFTALLLLTTLSCAKRLHVRNDDNQLQPTPPSPSSSPTIAPAPEVRVEVPPIEPKVPAPAAKTAFPTVETDKSLSCVDSGKDQKICGPKSADIPDAIQRVQWKQWESLPTQGDFGNMIDNGIRESRKNNDRGQNPFFVRGSAVNIGQEAMISGGIGILIWSDCWDNPGQLPCWQPDETAFIVDMIAQVKGETVSLGRTEIHMKDLHRMRPWQVLGYGSLSEFSEIAFSTTKSALYEQVEVRVFSVHPKLSIRASRSFVRATW